MQVGWGEDVQAIWVLGRVFKHCFGLGSVIAVESSLASEPV
jgi:hypothetical protein